MARYLSKANLKTTRNTINNFYRSLDHVCSAIFFYAAPVTTYFGGHLVILLIMHSHFLLRQPMFLIPPQVISTCVCWLVLFLS